MARALEPNSDPRHQTDALNPEVVDPRIEDVEALARWLDYAFVGPGGFRFGLPVSSDSFLALATSSMPSSPYTSSVVRFRWEFRE